MKTSQQMDVPQKSCGKSTNNLSLATKLCILLGGAAEIMMSRSCRKIKSKRKGNGFQIDASHSVAQPTCCTSYFYITFFIQQHTHILVKSSHEPITSNAKITICNTTFIEFPNSYTPHISEHICPNYVIFIYLFSKQKYVDMRQATSTICIVVVNIFLCFRK